MHDFRNKFTAFDKFWSAPLGSPTYLATNIGSPIDISLTFFGLNLPPPPSKAHLPIELKRWASDMGGVFYQQRNILTLSPFSTKGPYLFLSLL